MKQKRQRVYRAKQPGKRIHEPTSTGTEVRLGLAAGTLDGKPQAYLEWLELLRYLADHPRGKEQLMIPPEIVPSLPKPEAPPPIRWDWEPMARYTTFEGEEPDVWPTLEDNKRHLGWMAGFMAAILTYLLWRRRERGKILHETEK